MPRLRLALRSFIHIVLVAAPWPAVAVSERTPSQNRVLVVYENESTLFAVQEVARGLLPALRERIPDLEIYSEYMDAVRFPGPQHLERFRGELAAKYRDYDLGAVIPIGPGALSFVLEHRDAIVPGVPIVFGGVNESTAEPAAGRPGVGGVISRFDARRTIELARRLQPAARRLVVLTGSAGFDRRWERTARDELSGFEGEMRVEYRSGLTLDEFKRAVAALPADTVVLLLTIFSDADGSRFIPRDAAAEIVPISGAAVYSPYSSYMGTGLVGGFMETFDSIGARVAELAAQVVLGEVSAPRTVHSTGRPVVDWRQLQRFGIDEQRVPPDATRMFYEPSLWVRHRWQIVAIIGVILLQSLTIVALVVEGRRRRTIRDLLTLERLELAHLSRVSQLGQLSGALAHELRQPLTSILANAEAGMRLLDGDPADTEEVREILRDIISDDKRAAAVIGQLRQMMLKGEPHLNLIDLNEAVAATMKLANSELLARHTKVDFRTDQRELPVQANLAQLQQVVLNLLLNAADAMAGMAPAERRIVVETRLGKDGSRELSVSDRGPGMPPEISREAFRPFVTSKVDGLGLGLAICRSIAQLHGGRLAFDDDWNHGTRVVLALPAPS